MKDTPPGTAPGRSGVRGSIADTRVVDLRARFESGPPYDSSLLDELGQDVRPGARALYRSLRRLQNAYNETQARCVTMMAEERLLQANGFSRVAGVDEAGRGPLAGPIVAAAVVLRHPIEGLNDSKLLKPEERDRFFALLQRQGHAIGTAIVPVEAIDKWGIQTANYSALAQAASRLDPPPDFLLVDGFHIPGCPFPHKRLVKGDRRSQSIAAASVVAKVIRDRIMEEVDRLHPGYGFVKHKGYATAEHLEAIGRLGPCKAHRRSFMPVAGAYETGLLFAKEAKMHDVEPSSRSKGRGENVPGCP
jgi:ribonuclease HII